MSKSEIGEAPLEDFINFFNNVMKIQDFRSFLQACQNVCIIKKKKEQKKEATIQDIVTKASADIPPKEEEKKDEGI